MIQLKRILCCTDFSDCSIHAQQYACAFAERFEAELHVLHVIHDMLHDVPAFGLGLASPSLIHVDDQERRAFEQALLTRLDENLDKNWRVGRHVTFALRRGQPFAEILRYAREHAVDLIVVGTHGRTGLPHALLGSVAERVVRMSSCPVLTMHAERDRVATAP